jgi:hypothetical protein
MTAWRHANPLPANGKVFEVRSDERQGCISHAARTHLGEPAGLKACGGCGLAPSIMRVPTLLAAWIFIPLKAFGADSGVALKLCF